MKKILLVLSTILITHTVFAQIPTGSLLGWYPFCADTVDHSSNGNSLTNSAVGFVVPTLTADRFTNPGTAYEFNGGNNIMHTGTYFSASGDFSYSCWINPYISQSGSIIYNGNVSSNGFGLVMNNGTADVAGDSVSLLFGGMGVKISSAVTLNQWHQLVFTRSGNRFSLYIDTVLIGSVVSVFYPLTSPDVFNVGNDNATGTKGFSGIIDDIAVYGRELSLADITALYHFNPDVAPFTIGNDTAICTSSVVLAPSVATTGKYLWSAGGTIVDSTVTYTATPGDYPGTNYALTISVPYGCTGSSLLNVRHITTQVHLGNDTAFCAGNTLTLNTVPAATGETYTWSTGDVTSSIGVSTTGTYWLTVDSVGCFGTDTISVSINPQPSVNLGPDTSSCLGNSVTLQSSVTYTAPTYVWGAIPVLAAPATTPTFVASVTGTYWVTVTDQGCPGADTVHVLIVTDTFNFYQHDTAICLGASVVTHVTINPNISYQWRPTTGIPTSNVANPVITTSVSATYILTASYAGCPDILDSFHIDVQPTPIIAFLGQPISLCMNDTVHITAHVTPASYTHYSYSWSPGINLFDSTVSTIVFTPGDSSNLILTVTTPAGCSAMDSILIYVHPINYATITNQYDICPGDSVQLIPIIADPTITATFQWYPSVYLSFQDPLGPWAHGITTQNYMIVGASQFGCLDTISANVIVHPAAAIFLGDSVTIYPGQSYQIAPQTNCSYFSWTPSVGLSDTVISDPLATPAVSTKYIVRAATEYGCTTEDSISIYVSPYAIVSLPNAFTPGASINNYFKIQKVGLASLHYFRIYDRWGDMVYNSTDIDGGWDGTYQGKPQPLGVYVYELEVAGTTGKVYKTQGNVTLIR